MMDAILRDIRYSFRLLRKSPLFTLIAVLVIGLGLGANTLIFSVINGVLLNPLPYRDAERVVMIWWNASKSGGLQRASSAPADFIDFEQRSRSFSSMSAFRNDSLTFTGLDQPITPLTHSVTANYFDVLGVRPFLGRTFLPGEDRKGYDQVAIVSYSLWQSSLGADASRVGRDIELDGRKYQLVGVLPAGFHSANLFPIQPDLWVPLPLADVAKVRAPKLLGVVARLAPGVSLADAQAEMAVVGAHIVEENPLTNAGAVPAVRSIREDLVGNFRPTFRLLLAAVGFVLLIACANVANLLLVRSLARTKEMALRGALGAERREIIRQLLIESLMLAGLGAVVGITIAAWGMKPILSFIPNSAGMPFLDSVGIDGRVAGFTLLLTLAAGILFGLAPARQGMKANLMEVLNDAGRSGFGGRSASRLRSGLLVAEVALSFVLLAGAALVLESSWKLAHLNPGFDPTNVLTMRNSLRGESYATPTSRRTHFQNAIRKLEALPGVVAASGVSFAPPLSAAFAGSRFEISGRAAAPGQEPTAVALPVLPRYFEVMRIPLIAGRYLSERDHEDSAQVVVVSRKFAELYFPGESPIDRAIGFRPPIPGLWKIVGVVGDQRSGGIDPEPRPVVFLPHAQIPAPIMAFVIRTSGNPMNIAGAAQKEIWSLGKMMNVYVVNSLERQMSESDWQARFSSLLLAGFAGLALVLTAAGMYGVISYSVSQRIQEIGIRMALGAVPRDILRMVLRQGVALTVAGVVAGVLGSLALNRLLAGLLYGVQPTDPWTLVVVGAILIAVSVAACVNPARRAAGAEPVRVLRHL